MRFLRDHFPAHYGKAAAFIFLVALVASPPAHGAKADRKGQSPIARDSASRKYVSPKDLHSLIDQEGLPFSFTGLAKKTVLLNFIFTSCEAICPRQTQALVEIQHALPPALRQRVHFVSVTVDPDRDSAPTLKIYALAMGADLSDWSFVTGKTPELDWLQRYYAARDTARNKGPLNHQVGVYLLDGRGRLMQKYSGDFDKSRLLREIRQLDSLNE